MELWKDIPSFEGIYQASNCGRIRSAPDKVTSNARYSQRHWKCRVLKPKAMSGPRDDERVTLWKAGHSKDYLVSRLVALTWCNGFWHGATVNHIDGNYHNNRPDNLEWVSLEDNIRHGFKNGLYKSIQKPIDLITSNGHVLHFDSLADASRFLGRNPKYLSNALSKGNKIRSIGGEIYISKGND